MRLSAVCACAVMAANLSSCGPSDSGSGLVGPGGVGPDGGVTDAGTTTDAGTGTGGGATDAGTTTDAGTGSGGGTDGGTLASDCDGLLPPVAGAPAQYRWEKQDLNQVSGGSCNEAESDGTGHIALSWDRRVQPHDTKYTFIDSNTGAAVGSFEGTRLVLIGQASGFIGSNCAGALCAQNYVVVGPTGKQLYSSPFGVEAGGVQANDPTGGMVHVRYSQSSAGTTVLLDAISASGAIRWTRSLPGLFPRKVGLSLGVDRKGNVLALWPGDSANPPATWSGQWFDHDGTAGPVFQALKGDYPGELFERVGDGLFVSGAGSGWLGQFEALATSMSPPPAWLAARPAARLHMVHGGRGYAVLPRAGASSSSCEQAVEVLSPSGQTCGSSTFAVGGGSCTTGSIIVGYDGTVVQQLPREREAACIANDHICDCTYRYWAGYFR